jgi:type I restriction enzyme S subunit
MNRQFDFQPLGQFIEFYNGKSIKLGGAGIYPVYGSNGIIGGSNESKYCNGVIIGRVGAYCGSIEYCPSKFWASDNTIVAKPRDKSCNIVFLHYLLKHLDLHRHAGGAAQPLLTQTVLRHVPAPFPSLPTQRKIADILSAYDDLIENNNRRISILEEIAQAIYREWFVNFRFPGHEKVKFVDSTLGKIPEGWEVKIVNDIVGIRSGYAFKSSTFVEDGEYGLVTIKNVHDGRFVEECQSRLGQLPSNLPDYCHLRTGDILLSLTGNVGRTCLVHGGGYVLNQRVARLVPSVPQNRAFIYLTFRNKEMRGQLERIANGVAQQNLSPVQTARLPLCVPCASMLEHFAQVSEAILDEILVLCRKNANLHKTRDFLLPRLISGQVDVEHLDISVGGFTDGEEGEDLD